MIRYNGLYGKLAEKGITKTDLSKELGISSKTIAKIARGEKLSRATLQKIAGSLSCSHEELCEEVSANAILQGLREAVAGAVHGVKNKIRRAVHDAADAKDRLLRRRALQARQPGDAAARRCRAAQRDAVFLCQRHQLAVVGGDQKLVRGHHIFSRLQRT